MVDGNISISKYKNIFPKLYTPNWSKEVFEVKSVKDTSPSTDVIEDIHSEEIIRIFYKPEL